MAREAVAAAAPPPAEETAMAAEVPAQGQVSGTAQGEARGGQRTCAM